MKISVIGTAYLGLLSDIYFDKIANSVTSIDIDEKTS